MDILDKQIDPMRASSECACTAGLQWAHANPRATVRDLMHHRMEWGVWYLLKVLQVEYVDVIHLLGGDLKLTDNAILKLVSPGLTGAAVVRVFSAAWNDDARVAGLMVYGWVDRYVPNALHAAWGDDVRVVRALGYHLNDERLVRLLENVWLDVRVAEALSKAWGNDDRVARAVASVWHDINNESTDVHRLRRALRYAWDDARMFRALENLEPKGATNA
jgi:hypothetical protein